MVNLVIDAISENLKEDYSFDVYTEEVPQNFETPCFCVENVTSSQDYLFMKRSTNINLFSIKYFPDKSSLTMREECNIILSALYQKLEYIKVAGRNRPLRGIKREGKIVDNVLNFLVAYNFLTVLEKEESEKMINLIEKGAKING